jgi:hypothetical protein
MVRAFGTASALKKAHAAERHCAAVAAARLVWKNLQPPLDPCHLVFLDDTGRATNMARLRGRCRGGSRLIGRVPPGHGKTTTLAAGLRVDAVTAPFVIDRVMKGEIFRTGARPRESGGRALPRPCAFTRRHCHHG